MRYTITYKQKNGPWCDIPAKTIKEANAYYDMVGEEAEFKVLLDNVSGEQIRNT